MASKIHSESSLPIEPPESYPKNLPFTCLSCDDPCSSLDPDLAASIDMTSNMVGSIKPYARHFLIGSPAPWPSQIEEIPGSIVSELKTAAKERLEGKTIISATDGLQGILEFPSRKMYTLSHASTTKTVEEIVSGSDGSLVSQKAHIFVCVHMNRDKRCGVLGPLIVEAFHSEISRLGMDESVAVYGVSHVGGMSQRA